MTSARPLDGRVALVAGAAHGIGRAIADAFATAGAAVACADRDADGAREAAEALAGAGGRAIALALDVSDGAACARAVAETVAALGGLDVLVSGAAVYDAGARVPDLDEAVWDEVLRVNLTGAFLLSKAAIPAIVRRGGGSVILIASQLGRVASPGRAAYCATKGALIQLAKVMAVDHAADGVRVNTLSPGAVETDRLVRRYGDLAAARVALAPKHPLGRLGQPDEIADAAVFLASDASRFMTGADLLVDGGYTAV